jgi:hypothetical protein
MNLFNTLKALLSYEKKKLKKYEKNQLNPFDLIGFVS